MLPLSSAGLSLQDDKKCMCCRKGRGKRKAAPKSPAPKSPAKALSRTPSKRIGVLTPEELEAR